MQEVVRKPTFLGTVRTVLWGAIGVRRKSEHDSTSLNPVHVIAAGILFALLFIFTLLTIVKIVLSQA
jgi:Protein of unknown function (DUF2970)